MRLSRRLLLPQGETTSLWRVTRSEYGDQRPPEQADVAEEPTHFKPRSLVEIVRDLWHQKPGPREPKEPTPLPANSKEIVNGLERREIIFGAILSAIAAVLAVAVYFVARGSANTTIRHDAATYLIAGLVGCAILVGGVVFRRRALLGFASFLVGMEMLSTGFLYGAVLYLFFGGWLIFRVMKKQRQDQAAGRFSGTVDTGPKSRGNQTTKVPAASKRYTPPRRAATRAAASRRR